MTNTRKNIHIHIRSEVATIWMRQSNLRQSLAISVWKVHSFTRGRHFLWNVIFSRYKQYEGRVPVIMHVFHDIGIRLIQKCTQSISFCLYVSIFRLQRVRAWFFCLPPLLFSIRWCAVKQCCILRSHQSQRIECVCSMTAGHYSSPRIQFTLIEAPVKHDGAVQ